MAYTRIDRFIATMRFRAAFLEYAADRIAFGAGVDDQLDESVGGRWQRVRADLRAALPFPAGHFDHVVMLAVLEHLTEPEPLLREAHRVLAPGGSLIMTWPASAVDSILGVLRKLRLISDEMESDEHQKRIPVEELEQMLERIGFQRFVHRRFELGLNNLLIATKA